MSESKTILNKNGEKIFVEVFTPTTIKGTIVFCHGITGCRKGRTMDDDYFQKFAGILQDRNYKVVLFDFSGHGESEGQDRDVTLSKSTEELSRVFAEEVDTSKDIKFLAFSYGAAVLCNFLMSNPSIVPSKIVLFSPCIFPLASCFLSNKSIFGKDIVAAYDSGDLEKTGYAIVGAKNFKFGNKMIDECRGFSPDKFIELRDRILVLTGTQDVILETKYNEAFCKENNIEMHYYDASHSLFETIDDVFADTMTFFEV